MSVVMNESGEVVEKGVIPAVAQALRQGMTPAQILGLVARVVARRTRAGDVVPINQLSFKRRVFQVVYEDAERTNRDVTTIAGFFKPEFVAVVVRSLEMQPTVGRFLQYDACWYHDSVLNGGGPTLYRSLNGEWVVDIRRERGHPLLAILAQQFANQPWEVHDSWRGYFEPKVTADEWHLANVYALTSSDVVNMERPPGLESLHEESGFCYLQALKSPDRGGYAACYGPYPLVSDLASGSMLLPEEMQLSRVVEGHWHVQSDASHLTVSWKDLARSYCDAKEWVYASEEEGLPLAKIMDWKTEAVGTAYVETGRDLEFGSSSSSESDGMDLDLGGRVGTWRSSNCRSLGSGHLASDYCEACQVAPSVPWHHDRESRAECGAVDTFRRLRVGEASLCVVSNHAESWDVSTHGVVESQTNCVQVETGQVLITSAPLVVYFLPKGTKCLIYGALLDSQGGPTVVAGFGEVKLTIVETVKPGSHVGVRVGAYRDKIRFMHKYIGEDPRGVFSRFAESVNATLWWMPFVDGARKADGESKASSQTYVESGIPGVSMRYAAEVDKVEPRPLGAAFVVRTMPVMVHGIDSTDVLGYSLGPDKSCGRGALTPGLHQVVAFPRRVPCVLATKQTGCEVACATILEAVDEYMIDGGGLSPDVEDFHSAC